MTKTREKLLPSQREKTKTPIPFKNSEERISWVRRCCTHRAQAEMETNVFNLLVLEKCRNKRNGRRRAFEEDSVQHDLREELVLSLEKTTKLSPVTILRELYRAITKQQNAPEYLQWMKAHPEMQRKATWYANRLDTRGW